MEKIVGSPSSIWQDHQRTDQEWLEQLVRQPYRSYLYSYPHKTAYRPLDPPRSIADLWQKEQSETFFLYMHIPFCAARCGFCNLFTLPNKQADVHETYIAALERQARQWSPYLSHKPFSRFAIGGGTPTLLATPLLERLFQISTDVLRLDFTRSSISVETSPDTVTNEKLALLRRFTVDRISMGIQSFIEAEAAAVYRPQRPDEVVRALELIKQADFPIVNLDLIYGLPGQTVESWLYSLERALAYEPEEIFLYPLYTRDNTIVKPDQVASGPADIRFALYQAATNRLKQQGYQQYSMRRFAKPAKPHNKQLLPYSCQEDGMVGLGCGARSYTEQVHFASRYSVSYKETASIIADYVATEDYGWADYGVVLSLPEQKRRFVIKSLLHREGIDRKGYLTKFGTDVLADHPELVRLLTTGLAISNASAIRLTPEGLAYSDAIGDWLISSEVRALMEEV